MPKSGKNQVIPIFGGIASLREAKGWRQGYLAEKAGVSQSLISRLERGKGGTPSYEHLSNIASALGTTVDELKTGEIKEASASINLTANKTKQGPVNHILSAEPIQYQQVRKIPLYSQKYPMPIFGGGILYDHNTATTIEEPPILRDLIGAYAIKVMSDKMQPRYRPGDILFINPHPLPNYDDDIVIHLNYGKHDIMVLREVAYMSALNEPGPDEDFHLEIGTILPQDRLSGDIWENDKAISVVPGDYTKLEFPYRGDFEMPAPLGKLESIDVHIVVGSYRYRDERILDVSNYLR